MKLLIIAFLVSAIPLALIITFAYWPGHRAKRDGEAASTETPS